MKGKRKYNVANTCGKCVWKPGMCETIISDKGIIVHTTRTMFIVDDGIGHTCVLKVKRPQDFDFALLKRLALHCMKKQKRGE